MMRTIIIIAVMVMETVMTMFISQIVLMMMMMIIMMMMITTAMKVKLACLERERYSVNIPRSSSQLFLSRSSLRRTDVENSTNPN